MLKLVSSQEHPSPAMSAAQLLRKTRRRASRNVNATDAALAHVDPDAVAVILELIAEYSTQEHVAMSKAVNAAEKYPGLWPVPGTALQNPRPPAVPSTLRINLEQYYGACALMGAVSAHRDQPPNMEALTDWALDVGEMMAKKARERWK